jgi:hypothetical protein
MMNDNAATGAANPAAAAAAPPKLNCCQQTLVYVVVCLFVLLLLLLLLDRRVCFEGVGFPRSRKASSSLLLLSSLLEHLHTYFSAVR